jgi:hypothetical protein
MTSQVNPNNIDGTYPVAGQDNDSQGFRDNFTNIRNNLTYVKAEIEDIQNKVVLKSALTNTTLDNDFYGNIIANPSLSSWRETYNNIGSVSGSVTVNFSNGNFQKITMSGSTSLTFSWPTNTNNQYSSIKLWVTCSNSSYTLTLPSAMTLGDPDTIAGLAGTSPPIITFSAAQIANNTEYLFEFFTLDGGTTLGIKDLIRNRDVDLSGLSITGNLTLDNVTSNGNVVTTNGIFWAANGNPFSPAAGGGGSGTFSTITASSTIIGSGNIVAAATTNNVTAGDTTAGALIVKGSTGVVGNVNVGGNLWVNSGNIRSTSTRANIFNITASTISLGNAASFVSIGATGSNIFLSGGLTAVGNITTGANLITGYITSSIGSGSPIVIDPDGNGDLFLGSGTTSNVVVSSTTASTNTTTGGLVVTAGVGISGVLNVGGNVVATATTVSTSTTTGALVVAGGAGIAGVAVVGGNLVAAATTTSAAASTTTGALVVAGGVGIDSNINIGGNLVTTGGRINTSTFLATVVTGQELVANVAYNTFIIDTASSATIANLWVTIPASAVNGTEMVISTLAPLTSCNVRAIGGTVKWVPLTFASAGNVSVKLVYRSTSSAWLRSA